MAKAVQSSSRLEDIYSSVQELKDTTAQIQAAARMDPDGMKKAQGARGIGRGHGPHRGPRTVFYDPLSLQYALGYKDRRYSLTYDTLKRISTQLSLVGSIINTRIAQIASFSEPYRLTKSLGFQIRHKDTDHETTRAEKDFIKQLEGFILDCGEPGKSNPYTRMKRPKFESFLKTIVRDSLVYDQVGFEVVPRRNQIPFEFWPVDATTLRIATPDRDAGMNFSYHHRTPLHATLQPHRFANLYEGQQYGEMAPFGNPIQYVQVVNGQIENVYTDRELAFGVRNPRSDIYIQGYGFGELEQLITIITSTLHAEEYNRRFFMQGAHPKGMLNFKGDNWSPDQLEAFKRMWVGQIAGSENAWKTPITQSEGVEWINMQLTNQDMQFSTWLEYLIKIICGVYLMDPAEINFDLHGGVQQTPLFESSQEWKLKASRDRGLKPLLRFIARLINEHIITPIDDHFVFEFAGLDELTEQEKHEMCKEQLTSYKTLNEVRRELDLPDIPGGVGELPLNPNLIQLLQLQQQREDQRAQMEQQAQEAEAAQGEGEPEPTEEQQAAEQLKNQAAEQKIRHAEEKHPLDMEAMAQKVGVEGPLGGQPPMPQGMETPGQAPAPEEQAGPPVEPAPSPQGGSRKRYAGLFGKSFSFDDWISSMRGDK
jgi:hypothetical protein